METLSPEERRILNISWTLNARIRRADEGLREAVQCLRQLKRVIPDYQSSVYFNSGCWNQTSFHNITALDSGIFSAEYTKHLQNTHQGKEKCVKPSGHSLDVNPSWRIPDPPNSTFPGTFNSNVFSHPTTNDEDPTSTTKQAEILFRQCVKSGDATPVSTRSDTKRNIGSHKSLRPFFENSFGEEVPLTRSSLPILMTPQVEMTINSETEGQNIQTRKRPTASLLKCPPGAGMYLGDCGIAAGNDKSMPAPSKQATPCPASLQNMNIQYPIFETVSTSTPTYPVSNAVIPHSDHQKSVQCKVVESRLHTAFAGTARVFRHDSDAKKENNEDVTFTKEASGVVSRKWLEQLVVRLQHLLDSTQPSYTTPNDDRISKHTYIRPNPNFESPSRPFVEAEQPKVRLSEPCERTKESIPPAGLFSDNKPTVHRAERPTSPDFVAYVPVDQFCLCEEVNTSTRPNHVSSVRKVSSKEPQKPPAKHLPPRPKSHRSAHWHGIQVTTTIRPFLEVDRCSPRIRITNASESLNAVYDKPNRTRVRSNENDRGCVKRIPWR
ncbi:hypothetical protein CLF_104078 [Clonorchis sinensis]|uniref:Uncharacterized protein n=1 Tax=Clonorchis sinensis TaxID=79923 RepID=G7YAX2_CLOSI|nr:hypothetical protein CLF_104078 [Clonorchis sinensis]